MEGHAASCNGITKACKEEKEENIKPPFLAHHHEPIPGLFVFEDFITEEEEAQILADLDGKRGDDDSLSTVKQGFLPWKAANFNGAHQGKRWGVHCNLRDRKVSAPENPLPNFVESLILPKLNRIHPMKGIVPNEANAIDYRRRLGHFLTAHVDDRKLSKEPIANLSLAGGCYMTYTNVSPQRNTACSVARVWLPRRCLQVLTGRARYDFSHGILNGDLCDDRRVSVTLRESPLTVQVLQRLRLVAPVPTLPLRPPLVIHDAIEPSEEPIPGLFLFEDFISLAEERQILEELDRNHLMWRNEKHSGYHREKRWGVDHDLWSPHVRAPKRSLPHFMQAILLPKLCRVAAMQGCLPNEVNSIEYLRREGHHLTAHADDRKKYKEPIANLSLAGDCRMIYRNGKQTRSTAVDQHKVLLKRRCLQILTGKARYDYTHGIENEDLLSYRRVSVTMREIPF